MVVNNHLKLQSGMFELHLRANMSSQSEKMCSDLTLRHGGLSFSRSNIQVRSSCAVVVGPAFWPFACTLAFQSLKAIDLGAEHLSL